jgi:NH3-dependent NAD+ synthetase
VIRVNDLGKCYEIYDRPQDRLKQSIHPRLQRFVGRRLISAELRVIPMHKAVEQHFKDIDHDGKLLDVAYENAQARQRTQILVDLANKRRLCSRYG